jgi:hypothetical protein
MVLQGNQSTCSGSGATPPALPTSVTGTQVANADGSYTFTVAANGVVPASNTTFTAGSSYGVWCSHSTAALPGTSITYTPYNYAQYIANTSGGNFGTAGTASNANLNPADGTFDLPLSLVDEWNAVNWILNNPSGVSNESPNATDTQAAIWQLLDPNGLNYVKPNGLPNSLLGPDALALYTDAINNGLTFVPTTGQYVAVLMVPAGSNAAYQGFFVPVKLACSASGSMTLTKTSSVSNANAFQLITYTYTITNTGSTALEGIVIVDDNGTPTYKEDDVTINVSALLTTSSNPTGSLAPGASYKVTSTVYLPISLFYQAGSEAAFDTLIPQVLPSTTPGVLNQLLLTYLIDTDVSDNTYGTNASAGWAGNGGHTFAEELGNYAEFAFYDSRGNLVSDFDVNYLKSVPADSEFPSGYAGTPGSIFWGGTKYINYLTSTLADNLNMFPQFVHDTTNSPVAGTPNWQPISAYKVLVNEGIFGICGIGSASVKKNFLAATETPFGGKCGYAKSATYTPSVICSTVKSTAYAWATVCGCSTVVHAQTCLSVTLNGCGKPICSSAPSHQCQQPPVCHCTCYNCQHGKCGSCTHVGCDDDGCHRGGVGGTCPHATVHCQVAGKPVTQCW